MKPLRIVQIPCLNDNYAFLIHDDDHNLTAAVDTPDHNVILNALKQHGWSLDWILNTHHHFDHTGGNVELKKQTQCQVAGPLHEKDRIPLIDVALQDGDEFTFGSRTFRILDVPGHTSGHIAYHSPDDSVLFVGDTLFALGCGRLFEGTPAQMWSSLQKIAATPDNTSVYCAHEYTLANAHFALSVDPENSNLQKRLKLIQAARNKNVPTVPTTIAYEKDTNPFLRAPLILPHLNPVDAFAEIRRQKDSF